MYKKSISLIILSIFIFLNISIKEVGAIKIISKENFKIENKLVNLWDMFMFFWKQYDNKIPISYKYINLKIKWIEKNTEIYENIQKLVYVDVLKNNPVQLNLKKHINAFTFYKFAEINYKTNLIKDFEITNLKSRKTIFNDFQNIQNKIKTIKNSFLLDNNLLLLNNKKQIFADVYNTILKNHYNKDNIDKIKMIDEATKALAKWTGDKFTTFFPPVSNKVFNETLSWEYEWIWAYVDMEEPWIFKIVSPISDSPAEKAWLKGWDIVLKVDNKEIKEVNWINEVVSWIKWPAGSTVILNIKRWKKILNIEVIRWKIIIKEIEYKKLNYKTFYIKMKFFWPNISKEFSESLEELKTNKNINKIVFDLRGNGWWYLNQVSNILWHFVEKDKSTAIVKYYDHKSKYKSIWYNEIDFKKYKIIILQNWWTASASEIFIWTLKDYFPKTIIIWEQSYWKWSVQTIKPYKDWSSLKYTIAKWYTGKTETWIDGVWITPDIKIEMEKYWIEENKDKQLQKAINIR